MKIAGIIPARYKSSRFPGKPLVLIAGKPMIIHVAEKAVTALGKDQVWVATEDQRIYNVVESYGFQAVMTTDNPLTGTDRLYEASSKISADIYINIQGDEPVINPNDIVEVLEYKLRNHGYVINAMTKISPKEDPSSINIPKVLVNGNNDLIYMSRLPIPGIKDSKSGIPEYKKQVCIYAFSFNELKLYGEYGGKASFEKFEDIEILRFLDLGIPVKMIETTGSSLAVDIPEDVIAVENFISNKHNNINNKTE